MGMICAPADRAGTILPMPRRRSAFSSAPSYARSSMWLEPGMRRRPGPRRYVARAIAMLAIVAAAAAVAYVVLGTRGPDERRSVAERFAAAWAKGDRQGMWELLDADTQRAYPPRRFAATYRAAARATTATSVRTGRVRTADGGRYAVPALVRTRDFGPLRGTVALPVVSRGDGARIRW